MRFGPSLSPVAGPALNRRAAGFARRVVPDGLLPGPAARFDDLSPWTLDADWSGGAGVITKSTSTAKRNATIDVAIPAGEIWVAYTIGGTAGGSIGAQMLDPLVASPFANSATAQHVARFTSAGNGKLRLNANTSFAGTVEDIQAVDMTAALAQPSDIYIAAGQSLMAAESQSGPVDPALDWWDPRCLYVPGSDNATYGTTEGVIAACVAPLQMRQASQGVSPAVHFAREIAKATPVGRTVTIVACASGGTKLVGTDAEWNPAGSVGAGRTLYANMVTRALAAGARTPGSTLKGLLWAQGESDRSATMDTSYPPAFSAMLAQLRSDLSTPTMPVILIGPMPDDTEPNQSLFLQTQERLDQDSGDPTAISGVHYIARPAGYLSGDGTHPLPQGNRIAGRLAAERFIAEGHI